MKKTKETYNYQSSNGRYVFKIVNNIVANDCEVKVFEQRKRMGETTYHLIRTEIYESVANCLARIEELDNFGKII